VPEPVVLRLCERNSRPDVLDALTGLNAALHTVAAVGLMVDPRDLGRTLGSREGGRGEQLYDPTLFVYDQVPGGVGLASRLYDERDALLLRTRELLERCACEEGCPACVGPVAGRGRKAMALAVLSALGVGASATA
jgi:DEAD/DEAH box helicase domain-containing protein